MKAMESLLFLNKKRDGTIKVCTYANESMQWKYIPKEEAVSLTVSTNSVLITGVIEVKQGHDTMIIHILSAFAQTVLPEDNKKVIMKIRNQLVDILVSINSDKYSSYACKTGKSKVLHMRMKKPLYGMLKVLILYYEQFRCDIKAIEYVVNPYDMYVVNKNINNKQHTLTWHIDDIKASDIDPKVNNKFYAQAEKTYGSEELGYAKVHRGKRHDYLGMILDYSIEGKL